MSEIKVDALSTVSGSGSITVSNNIALATEGQIDINSTNLLVRSTGNKSGLRFDTSSYTPFKNGSVADGTVDLGYASGKYKDLYLGGGLKVGGTGAANTLDDYETGTWTPILVSTGATFQYSVQQGIYTKVGDLVTFNCVIQLDGAGNSFSGNSVALNGWPFANRNSQGAHGRFFITGRYLNLDHGSYTYAYADLAGNSSSAPLKESGDNVPTANLTSNDLSSVSGQLYLHGHYYTDA